MQITKSPVATVEMIEMGFYPDTFSIIRRIDRMLGGDPEPQKPYQTVRIAGKTTFSHGELLLDKGESMELGVRIETPIIDDLTGFQLFGVTPVGIEDRKVEFWVDYMVTASQVTSAKQQSLSNHRRSTRISPIGCHGQ